MENSHAGPHWKSERHSRGQRVGVSRQSVYHWLEKFTLGALSGLENQRPGPRVDWEERCGELEAENKKLKQEIRQRERDNTCLQAMVTLGLFHLNSPCYHAPFNGRV